MSDKDLNPVNPSKSKRVAIFWPGMVNDYLGALRSGAAGVGAMKIAEVEP